MVERKAGPRCKTYEDTRYALAADIGQSNDPTAVAVMEYVDFREVHVSGRERSIGEEFRVRHLKRLPLHLSYIEQTDIVMGLLDRPPLSAACDFVIDDSGVGRAVGDLWSLEKQPIRVTITGGDRQSARGPHRWMVPKTQLISALDARLHTQELKIAADLDEAPALLEELRDFRRHISAAGRSSYEARSGRHDDLLLAVSLCLWNFVGRPKPKPTKVGRYHQVSTRR